MAIYKLYTEPRIESHIGSYAMRGQQGFKKNLSLLSIDHGIAKWTLGLVQFSQ